jgi:hypothetical protein
MFGSQTLGEGETEVAVSLGCSTDSPMHASRRKPQVTACGRALLGTACQTYYPIAPRLGFSGSQRLYKMNPADTHNDPVNSPELGPHIPAPTTLVALEDQKTFLFGSVPWVLTCTVPGT